MNKINILPENLASKIAAGEVVQRPASVVKELLENSIDAEASKITIIIKDGGKNFIQIIDNGSGISEEDVPVSFQRHSTSKISTYEDLENIHTLGFRGEALASISAVSQVELISRTKETDVATKIKIEGIEIKEISKEAHEIGTSIIVKNLFFNTPARREFLKNKNIEFKHIFDTIVRASLSNPAIHFKFISGDDTVFNLLPNTVESRTKDIFGNRTAESLIKIKEYPESESHGILTVDGFVSKPDFARKTRVEQFIFLNNRYIVSRNFNHAVFQAYENILEKGNYPFFILYLQIDPKRVDVNVHPSKLEVKFQDERVVYQMINRTVRETLQENNLIPAVNISSTDSPFINLRYSPVYSDKSQMTPDTQINYGRFGTDNGIKIQHDFIFRQAKNDDTLENSKDNKKEDLAFSPQLLQLHNQYILMPIESGVMIIDQHAAHERVLYEKAVSNFSSAHSKTQQLLFPHTFELNSGDAAILSELLSDLEVLGFQVKLFGDKTFVLEGIPVDVKSGQEASILLDIIDLYKENEHNLKLEPRDNLAKSFACKGAIKFGDPLNQYEMKSLIEQLFSSKVPYVCPHGRPVVVKLSLDELAKRFGRLG